VTVEEATAVSADERQRCADLLYREAALLDARELRAWLDLFAESLTYWVPLLERYSDPDAELNLVYDDRSRLAERIDRLESGIAYAQDPPSRTVRTIANILVARRDFGYRCESAFMLYELRNGDVQILAGRYVHELEFTAAGLRIRYKMVELVNRTEPFFNLSFVL
jgi:benzoate/toluate 1,2-dioxygenase beta subunit